MRYAVLGSVFGSSGFKHDDVASRLKLLRKRRFNPLTSIGFNKLDCHHEWLVEDVLVHGQPGVIGGPMKTLKTSLMVDLAISPGTGTLFLGKFRVPLRKRVLVFSGESDQATLQDTARNIAKSKGVRLGDRCRVHWEFDLPRLSSSADRMALKRAVRDTRANVVFIDPLYLCLFDGVSGAGATNLYEVGPALRRTARACLSAGATPVFVHHANKSAIRKTPAACRPLTLEGLAFAGIGEFARQWMLLNRRGEYLPGSGNHDLMMAIEGSAGHSSVWNVRADESQPGSRKRGWQVKVSLWKPPQPEAETPDRSPQSPFTDED